MLTNNLCKQWTNTSNGDHNVYLVQTLNIDFIIVRGISEQNVIHGE